MDACISLAASEWYIFGTQSYESSRKKPFCMIINYFITYYMYFFTDNGKTSLGAVPDLCGSH